MFKGDNPLGRTETRELSDSPVSDLAKGYPSGDSRLALKAGVRADIGRWPTSMIRPSTRVLPMDCVNGDLNCADARSRA